MPGPSPLVITIPHAGTYVPQDIDERLTDQARELPDTDWYVDKLYDFTPELGANLLKANYSRYVVDLNRPPGGEALYPGKAETGLVPLNTFAGEAIYDKGGEPNDLEIVARITRYWRPYHAHLSELLESVRKAHGFALLWEAHSIRSVVPMFFSGRLPDLNVGTNDGQSAPNSIFANVKETLLNQDSYSVVLNERFKGGYTTRHYGRPGEGIYAVQLEIAQIAYMDETPPFRYEEGRAAPLKRLIKDCLVSALDAAARMEIR